VATRWCCSLGANASSADSGNPGTWPMKSHPIGPACLFSNGFYNTYYFIISFFRKIKLTK
jgi:hypothetical protein